MTGVSKLQFSHNHNYVATFLKIDYKTFHNLFDLGLEYCYGLFQTKKYSIAEGVRNIGEIIDFNR